MINAGVLYCPIEMSIEDHTLIVINSDGGDIQPVHGKKKKKNWPKFFNGMMLFLLNFVFCFS